MGTHAINSPSSLERRLLCPGSRYMEAKFEGEDTGSDASRSGTHSHTLLEMCLNEGKDAQTYLGQTLKDHDGEFIVDQERADRVQLALDYIGSRVADKTQVVIHTEVPADPGRLLGRNDVGGTADVVIVADGELEVIDYKDGFTYVEVANNPQLLAYAAGVMSDYTKGSTKGQFDLALQSTEPEQALACTMFDRVTTTIIQPQNEVNGEQAVNSHEYATDALIKWAGHVREDLAATEADGEAGSALIPGEKQCRFCDARGVCRARADHALQGINFPAAPASSQPVPTPTGLTAAERVAALDVTTLEVTELVRFKDIAPVMRAFLKDVDEHLDKLALKGVSVPGYHLVDSLGNKAWTLPEEEIAKKLRNRKMKDADIYQKTVKSPTQILKSRALTKEQKAKIERDFIERKIKGKRLEPVAKGGKPSTPLVPDGMFPATGQVSTQVDNQEPDFLAPPAFMQPPAD